MCPSEVPHNKGQVFFCAIHAIPPLSVLDLSWTSVNVGIWIMVHKLVNEVKEKPVHEECMFYFHHMHSIAGMYISWLDCRKKEEGVLNAIFWFKFPCIYFGRTFIWSTHGRSHIMYYGNKSCLTSGYHQVLQASIHSLSPWLDIIFHV